MNSREEEIRAKQKKSVHGDWYGIYDVEKMAKDIQFLLEIVDNLRNRLTDLRNLPS